MDARRLAAMDMWGTAGSLRRRRMIRAEFLNYVPLALHARSLSRPGALEAELTGVVDLRSELRKAGAQQFWIAVPFAVAVAAAATDVAARRR